MSVPASTLEPRGGVEPDAAQRAVAGDEQLSPARVTSVAFAVERARFLPCATSTQRTPIVVGCSGRRPSDQPEYATVLPRSHMRGAHQPSTPFATRCRGACVERLVADGEGLEDRPRPADRCEHDRRVEPAAATAATAWRPRSSASPVVRTRPDPGERHSPHGSVGVDHREATRARSAGARRERVVSEAMCRRARRPAQARRAARAEGLARRWCRRRRPPARRRPVGRRGDRATTRCLGRRAAAGSQISPAGAGRSAGRSGADPHRRRRLPRASCRARPRRRSPARRRRSERQARPVRSVVRRRPSAACPRPPAHSTASTRRGLRCRCRAGERGGEEQVR